MENDKKTQCIHTIDFVEIFFVVTQKDEVYPVFSYDCQRVDYVSYSTFLVGLRSPKFKVDTLPRYFCFVH